MLPGPASSWRCLLLSFIFVNKALARPAQESAVAIPSYNVNVDSGELGPYPLRTYVTEADLSSPLINFLQWDARCDDGSLYFLTPRGFTVDSPGPMIFDARGNLIWARHFDNDFGGQAYNLMVQRFKGEDYLTFWLGDDTVRGHGAGIYYMLNSSYDVVYRIDALNNLAADLHEFLITDADTALVTIYDIIALDGSEYWMAYPETLERPDLWIWDGLFQEIDIETGALIFEWRASDHVDVQECLRLIGPAGLEDDPFDWFHINSIQKDSWNNYLISARYTHSIFYIDGNSGSIIWTLGGKLNDFLDLSDGMALNFAWQHDARFVPHEAFSNLYSPPTPQGGVTTRLLTLFDNAARDQYYEYGLEYSRGLLLEITYPTPSEGDAISTKDDRNERVWLRDEKLRFDLDWDSQKIEAYNGTDLRYSVRVIQDYRNPKDIRSSSQGSMQLILPNLDHDTSLLVSYGFNAAWTEFAVDGTVICDAHFAANVSWERGDVQSYRAFKFPWTGHPHTTPAVQIAEDLTEVYVSWNGATEIATWVLQYSATKAEVANDDGLEWKELVRRPKSAFETTFKMPHSMPPFGRSRYIRLVALDWRGRMLENGASAVIDRGIAASYVPFVPHELTHLSGFSIFTVLLCNTAIVVLMCVLTRRVLAACVGKRAAGRLRWRNGALYRRISEW